MCRYKKLISVICVIFLMLNYMPFASADEPASPNPGNETIDYRRIENAYVDVSTFTREDLDYIDSLVRENDEGKFYIVDEDLLSSSISAEKYSLVEEQISICNAYEDISTYAVTGSESNPYVLEPDVMASVSASSAYWFKCSITGATDVGTNSTTSTVTTIYKKTLFGKTQIDSFTATTSNQTLKQYGQNSGTNTYLVCMQPNGYSTIKCRIKQHVDTHYIPIGARWTMTDQTAVPDTQYFAMSCWYVPPEYVSTLVGVIEHDSFLYWYGQIASLGCDTVAAVFGASSAFISVLYGFLGSTADNLNNLVIMDIKDAADPDSDGVYENGVKLVKMYIDDRIHYFAYPWNHNGEIMYGGSGQVGTWVNNEFEQEG